jgi:hypothetical protein
MHITDTTTTDAPTDDQLTLQEVAIVEPTIVRGSIRLSLSAPISYAGLEDAKALRYAVDEQADRIVAVGLDVEVDGRSDQHARALTDPRPDQSGPARVATIPPADFEAAFGLSAEDIVPAGLRLRVYAAKAAGVLVLEAAGQIGVDRTLVEDLR